MAGIFLKIRTIFKIIVLWHVCCLNTQIYAQWNVCDLNMDFLVSKGFKLSGHVIWETKTEDTLECARSCIRRKTCRSFNFDLDGSVCQLNSEAGTPTPHAVRNSLYSDIERWPSQVDPDCYKRLCEEDEICVPGILSGMETTCSYSCIKLARTCPLPSGSTSSQSRTVGSIYTHTCDRGYVGEDSAMCLLTGIWNKTLDTSCRLLYGSNCAEDHACSPINGTCINDMCRCPYGYGYNRSAVTCVQGCGTEWINFQNADLQNNCFFFGDEDLPYVQAKEFCANMSSQLVYVETAEEYQFLISMMNRSASIDYYNSLYQFNPVNGGEQWDTTPEPMPLTVNRWASDEPNDDDELCTVFYSGFDYMWADVACVRPFRPVCKKSLPNLTNS